MHATTLAIFREMSYAQGFFMSNQKLAWLTPPSVGRCLVILLYWITITVMLTTNAITNTQEAYYFERIGFRGAWITLMQVPLVALLAGKTNIVGFFIGSSYERLNWAHRWVSRTMLVTAAVHSGFFVREWVRADFFYTELQMMPMVKYGIGAGSVLLWMNISGLIPFRSLWYEFYIVQHLASIAVFLWLLYNHVPSYAMYNVWLAIGFIAFDRIARGLWLLIRNIHIFSGNSSLSLVQRLGYKTEINALPGQVTRVVLHDLPFRWLPGQHIYIWIPALGLIESHPFTIANPHPDPSGSGSTRSGAELFVRAHAGFTRRLYALAQRRAATPGAAVSLRSFVQGPFGAHPDWTAFDTLLLVSASTGASFTLPILEAVAARPGCVRAVHFLLCVRERPQCSCYLAQLRQLARDARQAVGLRIGIRVAVTREPGDDPAEWEGDVAGRCCCGESDVPCCCGAEKDVDEDVEDEGEELGDVGAASDPDDDAEADDGAGTPLTREGSDTQQPSSAASETEKSTTAAAPTSIPPPPLALAAARPAGPPRDPSKRPRATGIELEARRPMLDAAVRRAVEAAAGETAVVVCGGAQLSGAVRNAVARLSDERAVHKGTGAQGIFLWVEEFGF
jgi:NAD(P)H-flavin reductase